MVVGIGLSIGANQANVNDTYYHSAFAEWDQNNQNWYSDSRPDDVGLDVSESGAIDQYDFSFATNIRIGFSSVRRLR